MEHVPLATVESFHSNIGQGIQENNIENDGEQYDIFGKDIEAGKV